MTTTASTSRAWTLVAASLALITIFVDNTIVNVALPSIQSSLGASAGTLEWVVNAYAVAFASLILLGGRLGDRFGRKRLFAAGLVTFGLASAIGAISDSAPALIASRAVQGAGAALIAPLSLSLIAGAFPRERLGAAVGLWAGVSGVGLAIGPLVGGLLVETAGWHSIFWVNVPVIAAALAITLARVGESRDPGRRRVEILSAAMATAGLVTFVVGLTHTTTHAWSDPLSLVLVGAGLALLTAFALRERRVSEPLVPRGLVAQRPLRAAAFVIALAGFALLAVLWFLTLYLQNVRGWSAVGAGLRTLPLTLATLIVAPVAGKRLLPAFGARRVTIAGLLLSAGAAVTLTTVDATTGYGTLAVMLAVLGIGLALVLPVAAAVAVQVAGAGDVGVASGVANTARQLGGALGLAVAAPLGEQIVRAELGSEFGDARGLAALGQVHEVGHALGAAAQAEATEAFLHAFAVAGWLAAVALAVATLVARGMSAKHGIGGAVPRARENVVAQDSPHGC